MLVYTYVCISSVHTHTGRTSEGGFEFCERLVVLDHDGEVCNLRVKFESKDGLTLWCVDHWDSTGNPEFVS